MVNKKANKPNYKHISLMIPEDLYAWLGGKTSIYGSLSQVVRVLLSQLRESEETARPRKKTG